MRQCAAESGESVLDGLRMLLRSRLFVKLTVCVMLSGIVMEGMYELLGQYFQLKLHYSTADQASLDNVLQSSKCNSIFPSLNDHLHDHLPPRKCFQACSGVRLFVGDCNDLQHQVLMQRGCAADVLPDDVKMLTLWLA